MSDTPRTDKAARGGMYAPEYVGAHFARQLERELNETKEKWAGSRLTLDEIKELVNRLEYKIGSIECPKEALRSRIIRAVCEFSKGNDLFYKADKIRFENK